MSEMSLLVQGETLVIEASTTVLVEQPTVQLEPGEVQLTLVQATTTVVVDPVVELGLEFPVVQGPAGPQGVPGPAGAPNLVVGSVNTLTGPGLWVETQTGGGITFWVEDGT